VAEHNAGEGFDLYVAKGGTLMFGKIAHLFLGEFDVIDVAL
jgi:hypothetical protein